MPTSQRAREWNLSRLNLLKKSSPGSSEKAKYNLLFFNAFIALITIFIAVLTFVNKTKQDKFAAKMDTIKTSLLVDDRKLDSAYFNIAKANLEITKSNLFSSLLSEFVNGSPQKKEYILHLMTEVDSAMTYRIINRLATVQDPELQPVIVNVLEHEIELSSFAKATKIDTSSIADRIQDSPQQILSQIQQKTVFPAIQRKTEAILVKDDFCEKTNRIKSYIKLKKSQQAIVILGQLQEDYPEKINKILARKVASEINEGKLHEALEMLSEAVKPTCN